MKARKFTKVLLGIIMSLFVMFLAIYLLIQLPPVQTYIIHKLTGNLSQRLGTKVSIKKVNLKFFRTASLQEVYFEDLNHDTLLYAQEINASLHLFNLFQKKLFFNEVSFSDLTANFKREADEANFNFQFIIDHFSTNEPSGKTPWSIDFQKVRIYSGQLLYDDARSGQKISSDIGVFTIYLNKFDLTKKYLDIEQIGLGDTYLVINQEPNPVTQDSTNQITFPNTGWTFLIKQIRVDENELIVHTTGAPRTKHLNVQDLNLTNLSIFVDNFAWKQDSLGAEITQATFQDHSGFILDQFTGKLTATPQQINLEDLHIKTPNSIINNKTYLSASSFDKIRYFADSVYLVANFIQSKIDYRDLKLLIPGFEKTPYLNTSANEIIEISGDIKGTLNNLNFHKLTFNAKNLLSIGLNGKIRHLTQAKSTTFDVSLTHFNTSYNAIKKLTKDISISPGLALWDRFKLSGNLSGNFKNIRGRNFKLSTSSITRFAGDFDITGLNDLQTALFDIHVDDLRSISYDLKGFAQKDLPASLDSLGQFYYQGDFKGTIYDFAINGRLSSDAGSMRTDLKITFDHKYQDANYNGDLALDSFNLGKVLSNKSIGHLTMAINVFGSGLNTDVLRATVLGKVEELVYNDFHYHDLVIDGRFDKKQFAGHASIEDPNIAFNFEGVVNLSDSSSRFRFAADIDTINFHALGFTPSRLGVSGYLESDFNGTFPDNMKGSILGTKLRFSNLTDHYLIDSFLVLSDFSQQNKRSLQIQSKLMKAKMEGDFTLAGMTDFFYDYFNQYFPIQDRPFTQDSIQTALADSIKKLDNTQNFTFDVKFTNADNLIGLALPKLQTLDTVKLSGWVDSRINYLQITGYSNQIDYDGISFGPVTFSSSGDEKALDHVLSVNNVHLAQGIDFPYIQLDMTMANDSAYIGLIMEDASDSIQEKLNLSALVTVDQNQYQMRLNDIMVMNGKDWAINPDHKITYANGKLKISDLDLVKGGESLSISTSENLRSQDALSAFSFEFKNFQLNEVSQLLEVEDAFYSGSVNGNFTLHNTANKINYLADLTLTDLTLANERIGNLVIKSQQRTSDLLDILIRLDGGISGLDIRGTYNRSNNAIDLQGEIDQLEMKNLDPFLSKYIMASQGKVSGLFKVGGTSKVPVIDGNLELEKVSTLINYLQARYTFENEDIAIIQNKMTFNNFTLLDQNKNSAKINGLADFASLTDPDLNLNFKTSRFLVLNTPANSKDFYYGKLYVAADVNISGQLSHPVMQVNAVALDSTDFVLQPLVSQVEIQQEDFIIFANPNSYASDTSVSLQDFYQSKNYNFEISANIECTPNAQLTIVIDPATGDKLVCRGNGNLAINISPDGDPRILGNYIITQGHYAFNFQRVLKRTFIIDAGSRVDFVGDVFKSKFDISASYAVRTSTYELIKNQSTINAAEESRSRQRSEVEVKLKLTGTLEQPVAKFDIEIKDQTGSGVTSAVSSKLSQLREDESGMNKQVFGLLIFSNFIAEEQTTSASLLTDASQSAILSSVSNLLSNELNRLARRYIKGVDLDFGVDSYSSNLQEGSGLITELNVGLSKRLLNDRLTIKLGGNVQFENNDNANLVNNQNSTFSGDFVLEYKLSPDGNYNIKFFQALSNEENLFNPGVNYSETGISLFFTKSFNSKKYQLQLDE